MLIRGRAVDATGERPYLSVGVSLELGLKQARLLRAALPLAIESITEELDRDEEGSDWDFNDLSLLEDVVSQLLEAEKNVDAYHEQLRRRTR